MSLKNILKFGKSDTSNSLKMHLHVRAVSGFVAPYHAPILLRLDSAICAHRSTICCHTSSNVPGGSLIPGTPSKSLTFTGLPTCMQNLECKRNLENCIPTRLPNSGGYAAEAVRLRIPVTCNLPKFDIDLLTRRCCPR